MANKESIVKTWGVSRLLPGTEARQFEFHPVKENIALIGTLDGGVGVLDVKKNEIVSGRFYNDIINKGDTILGLAWSKKNPDHFITGSQDGQLTVHTVKQNDILDSSDFCNFKELTSIHLNSTEDKLLVSGYQKDVSIFDFETGKVTANFRGIHNKHINISRFTHHSPNIFATCSFDKYIKMWDTRQNPQKPIYSRQSNNGNVMVCFSPDDAYLLVSAVDNEVRQYLTVDGRLQMMMDIDPSGRSDNYTRSYYMNGGDIIVSGSSEQDVIHLNCAHTGAALHSGKLFHDRADDTLYIQSLRGSPHHANNFVLLVNYRAKPYSLELLNVNMNENCLKNNNNFYNNNKYDKQTSKGDIEGIIPVEKAVISYTSNKLNEDLFEDEESKSLNEANVVLQCNNDNNNENNNNETSKNSDTLGLNDIKITTYTNINTHGWLLCARSLYFKRLLSKQNVQDDENSNSVITLKLPGNLTVRAVEGAIDFMMTNNMKKFASIIQNMKNDVKSSTDVHTSNIYQIFQEYFDVAILFEMPSFFSFIEHEATTYVSISDVHLYLKVANIVNARQLLKYCLVFLAKNIKTIYRFHRLNYFLSLRGNKEKYFEDLAMDKSKGSKIKIPTKEEFDLDTAFLPLTLFQLSRENIECLKSILLQQAQFLNETKETPLPDTFTESTRQNYEERSSYITRFFATYKLLKKNAEENEAANSFPYYDDFFVYLQQLDYQNKAEIEKLSSNKQADMTLNIGMTMIDYFKNRNKSLSNYLKSCLNVNETSTKYQTLYAKYCKKYECIADLVRADMHEIGNGILLILNGNTRDSYYNYSKILTYDASCDVFSYTSSYGDIPLSQESSGGVTCFINHSRSTHLCLLHGKNFKTVKVLDTLTMQWSTVTIKGSEVEFGFRESQTTYTSSNRARSNFSFNSLSEDERFEMTFGKNKNDKKASQLCLPVSDQKWIHEIFYGKEKNANSNNNNNDNHNLKLEAQYMITFGGIIYGTRPSQYQLMNDVCVLVAHPTIKGSHGYNNKVMYDFAWIPISVTGVSKQPRPRVYHSSTILRKNGNKVMVVFGGCGDTVFNDFAVLNLTSLTAKKTVQWVDVKFEGISPGKRYHHNAVQVSETQFYIIGGHKLQMRNDVYLVTLIDMRVTLGGGEATLACEKIKAGGTGFSENLTFRCATLSKLSNKIYIFGGQPPDRFDDDNSNSYNGIYEMVLPSLNEETRNAYEITPNLSTVEDFGELPCVTVPETNFGYDMVDLFESSLFSDVEFQVVADDAIKNRYVTIKAHKFVLVSRSERFKALLLGGMSESHSENGKPIVLNGVRESVFKALLLYIYSDSLLEDVRNDYQLIMELYVAANEYTLFRLIRLCEGILLRLLEIENAAEFLEFAEQYGMADSIVNQRNNQLNDMKKISKQKFRRQCLICLTYEDAGCALDGNRCSKCNHDSFRLIDSGIINKNTNKVQCSILKEGCISFILRHYKEVLVTEGYINLNDTLKQELTECFKLSVYSTDAYALESKGLLHVLPKKGEF